MAEPIPARRTRGIAATPVASFGLLAFDLNPRRRLNRLEVRLLRVQPEIAPFREKLRSAGFYAEWKGKYGDQAWDILEKAVGKLS